MDYQQARQIRNMPSLSDLIRREAVYGKRGAFGSIKEALKQKLNVKRRTQAKLLGIKEKFDPMNWAKIMFGKTGAALYGRAMGRSEADMQYFAGRARPIGGRSYQIGETPKYRGYEPVGSSIAGRGDGGKKLLPTLNKMYDFLKKTHENEIRQRELTANKREENDAEDARRHRELIKTIKAIKVGVTVQEVKEQKEGGGLFDFLKDMVQSLIDKTMKTFQWIFDMKDTLMQIFKVGGNLLKFLGSNLFRLFMANPILLGMLTLGALAAYIIKSASAEANQAAAEGLARAGDVSTEGAAIMATQEPTDENLVYKRKVRILADRPSNKKSFNPFRDSDLQKEYLKEIGFDERTGLTEAEKKSGFNALDEDAQPIKKTATPLPPKVGAMPDQTDAETARLSRQNAAPPVSPAKPAEPIESMVPSSLSGLSSTISQNAELKLQAKHNKPEEKIINNNMVQSAKTRDTTKIKLPPVRNHEDTFKRMIYQSTRVV